MELGRNENGLRGDCKLLFGNINHKAYKYTAAWGTTLSFSFLLNAVRLRKFFSSSQRGRGWFFTFWEKKTARGITKSQTKVS